MNLFPVFLKLSGRKVLVVGGGTVAASKLASLQEAGAAIHVVAPEICPAIRHAGVADLAVRAFEPDDLADAWLVVAAATPAVNREVAREAAARRVFVNAVDDPDNASVYLGGVVRRSGVTFAISTDGAAPALAGLLREALDAVLPHEAVLQTWIESARHLRPHWQSAHVPMVERRPQLLAALNALYADRRATVEVTP